MPPRVLLTGAFKPFGVDDIHSRRDSKIELYHNQLTKYQEVFSPRIFHQTLGLHAIAANIEVPTAVLDFPTLDRFRRELEKGYDYVGIGAIMPNFQKVKKMAEETRSISPKSKIVIGGFCATVPDLNRAMDVDYVCAGEGISFMRELLGLGEDYEFEPPDAYGYLREIFGMPIFGVRYPHVALGLGCTRGCEFCSPSHFFGKKHVRFMKTGKELFDRLLEVDNGKGVTITTFLGDDNFLLDLKRA